MSYAMRRDRPMADGQGPVKIDPMATPRYAPTNHEAGGCYHVTSRPVHGTRLRNHGRGSRHERWRRYMLIDRIKALTPCFAVELFAYAVMPDHFHLVLRHDPQAHASWADEEVARRWAAVMNTRTGGPRWARDPVPPMADTSRLERARLVLGSMSGFLRYLEHPFAREASPEGHDDGRPLPRRFRCEFLATEEAVLAAMVHTDLHPIRSGEAKRLTDCRYSSISERLREAGEEALDVVHRAQPASGR